MEAVTVPPYTPLTMEKLQALSADVQQLFNTYEFTILNLKVGMKLNHKGKLKYTVIVKVNGGHKKIKVSAPVSSTPGFEYSEVYSRLVSECKRLEASVRF